MTISPTTNTTNTTGTTGTTNTQQTASQKSQVSLTSDINSFLTLLTTQLKNQDPLDPVKATEFTSQLAQFASVEQGIQTNSNLEKLIALSNNTQSLTAVSYLGKYVEAKSNTMALTNGSAKFSYSLPSAASGVAFVIQNASGVPVATMSGDGTAGEHSLTWDGTDSQGVQLPDGQYTITARAVDAKGQPITVQTYAVGTADGVDNSSGTTNISINGVEVPVSDVTTVKTTAPSA